MSKNTNKFCLFIMAFSFFIAVHNDSAMAVLSSANGGLFDVEKRKSKLQQKSYQNVRKACMAENIKNSEYPAPDPIKSLKSTSGYGSDTRAQSFSWRVMILAGRTLAGDEKSEIELIELLDKWAKAGAFKKTVIAHDAYYSLKRVLLPTIVAYDIVSESMDPEVNKRVKSWLNILVNRIDKKFNGLVDRNNHRYLTDSVLMVWGNIYGDDKLYKKGEERFRLALSELKDDGTLPLETRRGARANWYMRHAITSMVVMAEAAAMREDDIYGINIKGKTIDDLASAFIKGVNAPLTIMQYAAENYIPGPESDYIVQDEGILNRRGHGRHYLAFLEAFVKKSKSEFVKQRASVFLKRHGSDERPLIDEYAGGNATCFWWDPE